MNPLFIDGIRTLLRGFCLALQHLPAARGVGLPGGMATNEDFKAIGLPRMQLVATADDPAFAPRQVGRALR